MQAKEQFYANKILINKSHEDIADEEVKDINFLRRNPKRQEWTSYYTLLDYTRYVFFYLYHMKIIASRKGVNIVNSSPDSFLSELFRDSF